MDHQQLLADAAQRPLDAADAVLHTISTETLHAMAMGRGNSIAWLLWHSARQMDVQLADLRGSAQVWGPVWAERLGVHRDDLGFGDGPQAVAELHVADAGALRDYLAEVVADLKGYVATLTQADLDDVVDDAWDPPTTRGVRIVSVIDDAVAHVAQAAYARGLLDGWSIGY